MSELPGWFLHQRLDLLGPGRNALTTGYGSFGPFQEFLVEYPVGAKLLSESLEERAEVCSLRFWGAPPLLVTLHVDVCGCVIEVKREEYGELRK
jgi:hypothetical protein